MNYKCILLALSHYSILLSHDRNCHTLGACKLTSPAKRQHVAGSRASSTSRLRRSDPCKIYPGVHQQQGFANP